MERFMELHIYQVSKEKENTKYNILGRLTYETDWYHVYTMSDRCHNDVEIILDRRSVYITTQIWVFIFISDVNLSISKVIRYVSHRFSITISFFSMDNN